MKIRHGSAVGIGLVLLTAGVFPPAASAGPAGAHAATPAIAAGRVQPAGLAARLLPGARTGPHAEGGAISGTVLGAHSAPLAGACVSATGPGNSFTASTRTGGRFLITGLPPGRYVLEYRDCSAPSRYFARWSGGAGSPRGAAPVVVTPGQQRALAPVTLHPTNPALLLQGRPAWQRRPARSAGPAVGSAHTGAISGVVTGHGHPLRGICVAETEPNGSDLGATTSKTGRYTIRRVPAGRATVQFSSPFSCSHDGNWLTQWYKNINTPFFPDKPTLVRVRAGRTAKNINGRLSLGGEITGTVTSASDKKLGGICVNATGRVHGGRIGIAIRTSAKGRYRFHGLFAGSYTVSFAAGCGNNGNFLPQSWRNIGPNGRPTPIRVTSDRVVAGVNASLKPGAVISGKVRLGSKAGRPLRAVCVETSNAKSTVFASTITRADGSYRLAGLSTGRYRVLFQPCQNGNFITRLSKPVLARDGRTTELNVILAPGATISGVVTDIHGKAVPGICLELEGPPSGSPDQGVPATGKNGGYNLRQLSKGRYELQFSGGCGSKGSFAPQNYDNRSDLDFADPIVVSTGQRKSGIDAVMQLGATISGRVTNAAGHGLRGVCVTLITPALAEVAPDIFFSGSASNGSGHYRLTNLTPGQYDLAFLGGCGSGGYAEQWYRAQPGPSTATVLSAAGGRPVTGINAVMHPGGAISGTVTDPAGHKLSNVCVTARNISTGVQTPEDQAITEDGGYFIGDLPAGRYQVQFVECGFRNFRDQWYRNQGSRSRATPVTVTGGATTRKIDARLRPGGTITGTVTSGAGQPLRNICVLAFNATTESFGTSGKSGRYAVPDLSTGRYHLEVGPCSSGSGPASVIRPGSVRVVAPRTVRGVNERLAAGGAVSGTLLTASPAASAGGVCAEALPVSRDGVRGFALSGRNGAYTIGGLAAGQYRIFFGGPGCFSAQALATQWYDGQQSKATATIITVTAGHTTSGIGATLLADGTITGTVTSAPAAGLAGVCVIAQRQAARSQPVQVVTDAAGGYALTELPPGKYKVKFTSGCGLTGFATQWWHHASSAASATVIAVRAATSDNGIDAVLRRAPG